MSTTAIEQLIELALTEDIGSGDVTAEYFVPSGRRALAHAVARREGVVSGLTVVQMVFQRVDADLRVELLVEDGAQVQAGEPLLRVEGAARSILTAERTALNFMQRLSGVASLTAKYVAAVAGTGARILDTRKTTPGFRLLEKQAVVHGGGHNHRMGLYDRAMIKDNHLVAEGGPHALQAAILQLKADRPEVEVELEADRLDQVRVFLGMSGVDHILLDNMTPEELRACVTLRGDRPAPMLEASGGVTLATIRAIAETGVDFISVGALTHSAPALDIGLDFSTSPNP